MKSQIGGLAKRTKKKGEKGGVKGGVGRWGWGGGAWGMQGFWRKVHAKTRGLDQVSKLNYGQKSPNLTKSIEKPCDKKGFCLFIAQK